MLDTGVWDRRGQDVLSKSSFMLALTGFTALGIIACLVASSFTTNLDLAGLGWGGILIALFAVLGLGFMGIVISARTSNPALALLGLGLVSIPMGLFIGPMIGQYSTDLVFMVGVETTALVLALGVIGATIKKDLRGWGTWLLGGLIILLIGIISVPIMGMLGLPTAGAMLFWNWAGLLLFGAIVVFDFNRAVRVPRTLKNAIDCSISIFLDWINIFIRLLALQGGNRS